LHDAEQDLGGLKLALGRAVGELGDDRLALTDLAASAVLSDDNLFVERVMDRVDRFLASFGRPRGLPETPGLNRV
jgi:hypothetical protein